MVEKKLAAVPAQSFTANGTNRGVVTIADATLFKQGQLVNIVQTGLPTLNLVVKAITSSTTLVVGPVDGKLSTTSNANPNNWSDISAYTTSATIDAAEQNRPLVPFEEYMRYMYEEGPTAAQRVILVDKMGAPYVASGGGGGGGDASAANQLLEIAAIGAVENAINGLPLSQTTVQMGLVQGSAPVTTTAYTTLIASTASAINAIEVFNSTGQLLLLATGAASSEVDVMYIMPGGNGKVPLIVGAGERLSLKAVSDNTATGLIAVNLYAT